MRTYSKAEVLKAMRTTLQEYKDRTHYSSPNKCNMCILFRDESIRFLEDELPPRCVACPMFVFHEDFYDLFPCLNRYCAPVTITAADYKNNGQLRVKVQRNLNAVINFYTAAIKRVYHMTNKEINTQAKWEFLVGLDMWAAQKNGIKIRKK